jgi:hypothetical protein
LETAAMHRLAELDLAQFEAGEWELTPAGRRLLPLCSDNEAVLYCGISPHSHNITGQMCGDDRGFA